MSDASPPFKTLLVERAGEVERLTLNRPARMNSVTMTMVTELNAYFSSLVSRPDVRVVTMTGAGRGFCAGMDIFETLEPDGLLRNAFEDRGEPGLDGVIKAIRRAPQPVIALVNGPAVGAGLIFALAADLRLAAPTALFKTGFVKLGASGCELGVSYLLPRVISTGAAAEMIFTGRAVAAERALALGLVSEVAPAGGLEALGAAYAAEMLEASPLGLRRTKETFHLCLDINSLDGVMAAEYATQIRLAGADHRERLAAFRATHGKSGG
ncbi:MAG: enoyl-CoA hydratase/isomerase family protein [Caulobacteraceae bacterium]|nr:enoyl-CoA hydratase/isomerase family protein [Caulobacteraceae bacterium]